ncbi:hypothetical protein [Maribacter sp.]|uniref:hypothetical protein n=1 Tax=Maribacter sp. TaxID=1897614 RepID=UPI0025BF9A40|nr:hypothetical protein [Maribacter sp.]
MKYYKLQHNWDRIKEIGKYPQAETAKRLPFNTNNLGKEIIKGELIPPQPILKNKVKPTTLLSVVTLNPICFLVFKNNPVLNKFRAHKI